MSLKLLVPFGLFLLVACLPPATEEKAEEVPLHKNANGRAEGLQKNYYEDGKIKNEVTYVDGKRTGPARQFYTTGKLESEITYKDNQKDGPSKWYYEDGILYQEVTFVQGKKHGEEKKYHNTGKLMARLYWDNGRVLPGLKEYDFDGKELRQPYIVVSGQGKLTLKLSNADERVEFYVGKLAANQALEDATVEPLQVVNGVATYQMPAGATSVHFIAKRKTALKNEQLLTLEYKP